MTEETHFHHQKNIQVGRGRILYDETGGIKGGKWCPPGWVLPVEPARTTSQRPTRRRKRLICFRAGRSCRLG